MLMRSAGYPNSRMYMYRATEYSASARFYAQERNNTLHMMETHDTRDLQSFRYRHWVRLEPLSHHIYEVKQKVHSVQEADCNLIKVVTFVLLNRLNSRKSLAVV